jgi:hypothetical protein
MILVYLSVRKRATAGERWLFRKSDTSSAHESSSHALRTNDGVNGNGETRTVHSSDRAPSHRSSVKRLQRSVFWQCFLYLAAFYVTWPIAIAGNFLSGKKEGPPYIFWWFVFFLNPLQGFWNFLIYIRPRLATYVEKRRQQRRQAQQNRQPSRNRVTWLPSLVGHSIIELDAAGPVAGEGSSSPGEATAEGAIEEQKDESHTGDSSQ